MLDISTQDTKYVLKILLEIFESNPVDSEKLGNLGNRDDSDYWNEIEILARVIPRLQDQIRLAELLNESSGDESDAST